MASVSLCLSVGFSYFFSKSPTSDGKTAVILNTINLALFLGQAALWRDRATLRLLLYGAVFGVVELLADWLCVRSTRTLDYTPARSWMLGESPWWMPFSWLLVAAQLGVFGDLVLARLGALRGAALMGLIGALVIPFYEEMAYGAHWWRYTNCWRIGHTPVYIIVAEAVIGAGLALTAQRALRGSLRDAALMGVVGGVTTIIGGMLGWGLVEFIGRGMRPSPLF